MAHSSKPMDFYKLNFRTKIMQEDVGTVTSFWILLMALL